MPKRLTLHRLVGVLTILFIGFVGYVFLFKYEHAERVIAKVVVPPEPASVKMPEVSYSVSDSEIKTETGAEERRQGSWPDAWVIKVASFNEKGKAELLVNQLRKHQFATYIEETEKNTEDIFVVFVGPDLSKTFLEKQLQAINEIFHMNGNIVKFEPVFTM